MSQGLGGRQLRVARLGGRQLQFPTLGRRQLRVVLGALWLIDAGLQAQPQLFGSAWWRDDLAQSVMGQPAAINHSIYLVVDLIATHAAVWNGGFVAVQALLGLCLVSGRFERVAVVASVPWALGVWWVGEGFGGLPTGFALLAAGAPGPVLYYPLLGLLAWPAGPDGSANRPISRRAGFLTWAGLWVGGAMLQFPWEFGPGRVLQANLEEYSLGQPAWLRHAARYAGNVVGEHALLVAALLAVAEAAIGLGGLVPKLQRPVLAAGMVLGLLFWVLFQDFGGVLGGAATDVGAAPLLILLGMSLWRADPALSASPARLRQGLSELCNSGDHTLPEGLDAPEIRGLGHRAVEVADT